LAVLRKKALSLKRLLILELFVFEVVSFIIIELYKYYYNLSAGNLFSFSFTRLLIGNFSFFYTGNLLWLLIFITSIISLINIIRYIDKVSEGALSILTFFTIVLIILFIISIFLPGSEAIDRFTGNFLQLGTKSTQTIILAFFSILKIFLTISYAVIAFSVLKKFYIFRSIWLTILILLGGIFTVFISIYYYKDDSALIAEENRKFDAGVILGAAVWGGNRPSPVLRERINKGYELYKNGNIKNLVLTGGGSPGEMTEAEVARNELLKKGIDEKFIFVENRSNSTIEQITYINRNLYRKNNWNKIILITDNFHLLRSKQMCTFFKMNAWTVASDTPLSAESTFSYSMKESFAVILFWLFGIG
jgi:uncharacterized SAM-binding protein YcdF (DUF218 family)